MFYRYMLAFPRGASPHAEMLPELVALLDFHQEHFGDYLEGVVEGEISLVVLERIIQQTS